MPVLNDVTGYVEEHPLQSAAIGGGVLLLLLWYFGFFGGGSSSDANMAGAYYAAEAQQATLGAQLAAQQQQDTTAAQIAAEQYNAAVAINAANTNAAITINGQNVGSRNQLGYDQLLIAENNNNTALETARTNATAATKIATAAFTAAEMKSLFGSIASTESTLHTAQPGARVGNIWTRIQRTITRQIKLAGAA